jgi:hypothetical protein
MSLHWLEREKKPYEAVDGVGAYVNQLALARRYQRLSRVLSQIAPGERSRFFGSPHLDSIYKNARYSIHGVDESTYDLTVQDPSRQDPQARLARISLTCGAGDLALPRTDQVEQDTGLILLFESNSVNQPNVEENPNAELILYPRVTQLPPTVRFYKGGGTLGYREHSFALSGEQYSVLVPNTDPSRLPLASYVEMLEVLSEVEHLYTPEPEHVGTVQDLQSMYPQYAFENTNGDWSTLNGTNPILHVGGGTSNHNLLNLLESALRNTAEGRVYYELDGTAVLRFCITH